MSIRVKENLDEGSKVGGLTELLTAEFSARFVEIKLVRNYRFAVDETGLEGTRKKKFWCCWRWVSCAVAWKIASSHFVVTWDDTDFEVATSNTISERDRIRE